MGNLCDCLSPKEETDGPTSKTPLLTGSTPRAPEAQHSTGSHANQSARSHKPPEKEELVTSLDELHVVTLSRVSSVPSLDKTFQDHAKLYNDLYTNFTELRRCLHDFKAAFVSDTAGIPVMSACLDILATRCGGATLTGSRTKNCLQIAYDKREVSESCQGPAEDVLETLEIYNRANRLIKGILDKAPQVKSSIALVLEEEAKLKREVTKADPDGKLGPEPVRVTGENFLKLHKLPSSIDTVQKYTQKTFQEIVRGSKALFQEAT